MLASKTVVKRLPIHALCLDRTVQMREVINQKRVQDYAELLADPPEGWSGFPPIIVYYRFGGRYYVADGWHRYHAHKRAAMPDILCEVRDGSRRDAVLCAAGSNADHGLQRTNVEKRRSIIALITDEEWGTWSSMDIARMCRVSRSLVEEIRRNLTPKSKKIESRKMKRNGKVINRTVRLNKHEQPEETKGDGDSLIGVSENPCCPHCGRPYDLC